MSSMLISSKLVDEPITIHCIFILSSIDSCLNQLTQLLRPFCSMSLERLSRISPFYILLY